MKLTIVSEDLRKALATVGSAVETRPTLPVLSHVLLEANADRGELTVAGTNLEQYIRRNSMANVEDGGTLTVPWKLFNDLVGTFRDGERVQLSVEDGKDSLLVQCGTTDATLKGIDAQEFPLPHVVLDTGVKLAEFSPADLMEWLRQIVFAASTDESRPVLAGVFVESKQGVLSFVTADGFRLAWKSGKVPTLSDGSTMADGEFIMPVEAANDLYQLLAAQLKDGRQATVSLFLDPDRRAAHFRLYDVDFVTQLIVGNYVNYRQIVPQAHATRVTLDSGKLKRLVKTASLYVRHAANVIHLEVNGPVAGGNGTLVIRAEDAELGEFTGDIDAEVDGEPVVIAFNAKFLLDALGGCGTPRVLLEMNGGTRPGVVKPVGEDGYLCVIMPMHIRS